jgi:hypothetical protein
MLLAHFLMLYTSRLYSYVNGTMRTIKIVGRDFERQNLNVI